MIDPIWRAFEAAPRPRFLPVEQRKFADIDAPLSIGYGVTNSQPTTVANMLRLLDVPVGAFVLDVGSGSGWTTALLAELVGPQGRVYGVERIPELVDQSREALGPWPQATVHVAERGTLGLPMHAPFDRILVSANADTIPQELIQQLGPGGTMVLPVASRMLRITKDSRGSIATTEHGLYSFVPLLP